MQVNMLEAKNRLSNLIVAAERGEEVLIARNGVPVARIVPYVSPRVAPPRCLERPSPLFDRLAVNRD